MLGNDSVCVSFIRGGSLETCRSVMLIERVWKYVQSRCGKLFMIHISHLDVHAF